MDEATRTLLLQSDSSTAWEFPENFDYQKSLDAVCRFQRSASQTLKLDLQIDDQVQDASFFADLGATPEGAPAFGVRFSSFGRLAAVYTQIRYGFSSEGVPDAFIKLLKSHGYTVIRVEELAEEYDGLNPELWGVSWFERFFDYS